MKKQLLAASASVLMLTGAASAAPIVFDTFTVGQEVDTDSTTVSEQDSSSANLGSFAGGDERVRTISVVNFTDTNGDSGTSAAIGTRTFATGSFDFNNTSFERGQATIEWDYTDTQNFAVGSKNEFALDFLFVDENINATLMVMDGSGNSASFTSVVEDGFDGVWTVNFNEFAGVDFSEVAMFSLVLASTDDFAADVSLGSISVQAVPIPGAAPLLLSGLAGFGLMRSRKKRQA